MQHRSIGDHPDIANALATGYPDGKEPDDYRCPVCDKECESIFKSKSTGEIVGCDRCIECVEPWEVEDL